MTERLLCLRCGQEGHCAEDCKRPIPAAYYEPSVPLVPLAVDVVEDEPDTWLPG